MGAGIVNVDIGNILSGIGGLAKDIRSALTGKLNSEQQADIDMKLLAIESAGEQAQTEINKIEASNPSLFVSGWRPFIGWTCGMALAYNYIGYPIMMWAVAIFKLNALPPSIDSDTLMELVIAMLGLGGLRTFEKLKNVARKK